MATVINTTPATTSSDTGSGAGFLVAVLVLAVMAFLFFFYGVPALRGLSTSSSSPQINVPDKLDVNVKQGQ